jgi:chaperonin GroES
MKKKEINVAAKKKLKSKKAAPVQAKAKTKAKSPTKIKAKAKPSKTVKPKKKAVIKKVTASKAVAPQKISSTAVKAAKWDQFLTPLDDRLLVKLEMGEKRTAGGLYIPDTAAASGNRRGVVVAAGPGHKNKKGRTRPMDVKAGDTVVFSEFVGTMLNLNGADVQLVRETEILGIIEN